MAQWLNGSMAQWRLCFGTFGGRSIRSFLIRPGPLIFQAQFSRTLIMWDRSTVLRSCLESAELGEEEVPEPTRSSMTANITV